MSAFVVSKTHIDTIVTYAVDRILKLYCGQDFDLSDIDDRNRLGQLLFDANYLSVNYRYGENDLPPAYRFERVGLITPVQMIKALHCLDYQCCEVNNWEETQASKVIEALIRHACRHLDGYDDAKWGIL